MIVKLPDNEYERDLLDILIHNKEFSCYCDGDKGIMYDLILRVHNKLNFSYKNLDLIKLLEMARYAYKKSTNQTLGYAIDIYSKLVTEYIKEVRQK